MASEQKAIIVNGVSTNTINLETNVPYQIYHATLGYGAIGVYEYKYNYGAEFWTPINSKTFTSVPDQYVLGVKHNGQLTISITNGINAIPNFGIPFRRTDDTVTEGNPGNYYGETFTSTYTAAQGSTPESNIVTIPSSLPFRGSATEVGTIPVAFAFSGIDDAIYSVPTEMTFNSSSGSTTAQVIKVSTDATDHSKDIYAVIGVLPARETTATLNVEKQTSVTLADGSWQDYGTDFNSTDKIVGSWYKIDDSVVTFTPASS